MVVCLQVCPCAGMGPHVREGVKKHDIHCGPKSYNKIGCLTDCIFALFIVCFSMIIMKPNNVYSINCLHGNRRLNNNTLTGTIPRSLTTVMTLQVLWVPSWCLSRESYFSPLASNDMILLQGYDIRIFLCGCRDLSNNQLTGDIPVDGSFSLFTPIR